VLVTDIDLTGKMNGMELARLARIYDPMLRVVVISGQHPAAVLPEGVTFLSNSMQARAAVLGLYPE
jgi:DNA-binding LytR/AlgR family response regulator